MADMVSDAEKDTETFVSWREFLGSPYAASLALVCLAVWLHAADSLIVATMLPAIVAEIGGIALVGWSVSLYEIGSIVAGAASALLTLRFGLRAPMSMAAALFGVGCILSAVSPTMPLLLTGRALQGLGGGGLVAMGFVAVWCAAANTPLAGILMAIELFGPEIGVYASVACVVSYLFSGHTGIYTAQRIDISKNPNIDIQEGMTVSELERSGVSRVPKTGDL